MAALFPNDHLLDPNLPHDDSDVDDARNDPRSAEGVKCG